MRGSNNSLMEILTCSQSFIYYSTSQHNTISSMSIIEKILLSKCGQTSWNGSETPQQLANWQLQKKIHYHHQIDKVKVYCFKMWYKVYMKIYWISTKKKIHTWYNNGPNQDLMSSFISLNKLFQINSHTDSLNLNNNYSCTKYDHLHNRQYIFILLNKNHYP